MAQITYQDAGVDLDLYQQAMQRLPGFLQRTRAAHGSRVMDLPGGFAGLFRLNDDSRRYQDPVLVSGTDGVGTKIKVAINAGRFNSIGIDLVAMCVNDCLCLGAEPLFFLDYLALPKDDPELIVSLVEGVSEGCVQAKAALLGGETAVMPDLYAPGDFDMAGFCVGVVEQEAIIDGSAIRPGDAIVGLASNGFHSNGYSLIRKAVFEIGGLGIDDAVGELDQTVGDVLLTPTHIYSDVVAEVLAATADESAVTGMAHITGGGLVENVERILPENCRAVIDRDAWPSPACFDWLENLGGIDHEEMFRVFNMGIGMAVIVRPNAVETVREAAAKHDIETWTIGEVCADS